MQDSGTPVTAHREIAGLHVSGGGGGGGGGGDRGEDEGVGRKVGPPVPVKRKHSTSSMVAVTIDRGDIPPPPPPKTASKGGEVVSFINHSIYEIMSPLHVQLKTAPPTESSVL